MNIFGDPFAGAANLLGQGAQVANNQRYEPTSYAGYPRGMKPEEHSRFMEFVGAVNDHHAAVVDRWGQVMDATSASQREVEAERGRQERLTMSHAVRQGNKVDEGVSVSHGVFSASRQHAPASS